MKARVWETHFGSASPKEKVDGFLGILHKGKNVKEK